MIAEADHAKTLAGQVSIPTCVAPFLMRLKVLPAVELDDQVCGVANEVDNVRPNRGLAPKTNAVHAVCPECGP